MHPDMITPKFNVGDEVWFIDKTDNIGKAVKGTVVEADIGSYRVKCNNRIECNGHYLSPYEMFDTPEKAYNCEISSVESSIALGKDSIKEEQENLEKNEKALAVLKERKKELKAFVWITDCGEIKCVFAGDEKYLRFTHYKTQEEAWKALAEFYREKYEAAESKAGMVRYLVRFDGEIILLKDCKERFSTDGTSPYCLEGCDYSGAKYSIALPQKDLFETRRDAEREVRRRNKWK